jgi:hypothetical protein
MFLVSCLGLNSFQKTYLKKRKEKKLGVVANVCHLRLEMALERQEAGGS